MDTWLRFTGYIWQKASGETYLYGETIESTVLFFKSNNEIPYFKFRIKLLNYYIIALYPCFARVRGVRIM